MPDPTLHGNGDDCPACTLRREQMGLADAKGVGCNQCDGTGRIPRSTERIIADHVAWAQAYYWPVRGLG